LLFEQASKYISYKIAQGGAAVDAYELDKPKSLFYAFTHFFGLESDIYNYLLSE
jgi:hypothetical protein